MKLLFLDRVVVVSDAAAGVLLNFVDNRQAGEGEHHAACRFVRIVVRV